MNEQVTQGMMHKRNERRLPLWSPTALQPWSLWYLRRNPPKPVLLRDGFGGHPPAFLHGLIHPP
jgi:hypothetical protein